jgi:hypothetical protein
MNSRSFTTRAAKLGALQLGTLQLGTLQPGTPQLGTLPEKNSFTTGAKHGVKKEESTSVILLATCFLHFTIGGKWNDSTQKKKKLVLVLNY